MGETTVGYKVIRNVSQSNPKIETPTVVLETTMGGCTVFGYEFQGEILYGMHTELSFDEIYGKYMANQDRPGSCQLNHSAKSVKEYFSERLCIEEDSIWRILYRIDGSVLCRRNMCADVIVRFH